MKMIAIDVCGLLPPWGAKATRRNLPRNPGAKNYFGICNIQGTDHE